MAPPRRADPVKLAIDARVARLTDDFLQSEPKATTRRSYANDLALFFCWLRDERAGTHPLEVRRADIDRFRNWMTELRDGEGRPSLDGSPLYAASSVARRLSSIRGFYAYLVTTGVLAGSPAVGVKGPKVSRTPKGKGLSKEQLERLVAAANDHSATAYAAICLLGLNGLRVHEVCKARIEDLELVPGGGRCLQVIGKGDKHAHVPLNATTDAAVTAAVAGRKHGAILLRPADRRRKGWRDMPERPFNQPALSDLLVDVGRTAGLLANDDADEAELERLNPHRLRHTFVTVLLDTEPLVAVQDAARHSSPDTTRLYDRPRDKYGEHPTHKLVF